LQNEKDKCFNVASVQITESQAVTDRGTLIEMRDIAQKSVDRGKDIQMDIEKINELKGNMWCPPPLFKQEEFMKSVCKTNKHLGKNDLEIELMENK
jgi:hypothetical protein